VRHTTCSLLSTTTRRRPSHFSSFAFCSHLGLTCLEVCAESSKWICQLPFRLALYSLAYTVCASLPAASQSALEHVVVQYSTPRWNMLATGHHYCGTVTLVRDVEQAMMRHSQCEREAKLIGLGDTRVLRFYLNCESVCLIKQYGRVYTHW
jgi:hypothetical protein